MKKALAILLSAMLILSFAACGEKDNNEDFSSNPTSTPGSSQSGNQNNTADDNQTNSETNSENNNSSNNESGNKDDNKTDNKDDSANNQTPPVVEDTNKEDITAYVPYGTTNSEGDSQYFPPEMDSTGQITPGVTVETTKFEVPEFFEAEKAIRICKNENASITVAKLAEYANEYAKAYNKYYSNSNYKLTVSVSGNVIKYAFTISGTPADRGNTVLQKVFLGPYFDENADFYKAQAKKYKAAISSFGGIEVSIVRANGENVITRKFS